MHCTYVPNYTLKAYVRTLHEMNLLRKALLLQFAFTSTAFKQLHSSSRLLTSPANFSAVGGSSRLKMSDEVAKAQVTPRMLTCIGLLCLNF